MGICEKWTISYRLRNGTKTLPDDLKTPFKSLPNTWRYWRADPFLVESDGKNWIFAELFDRLRLKGVLGCCELTDAGTGKWKIILDEPFHLSYPFVFFCQGRWYMIPESCEAGKIILYQATDFPWHWERVTELADIAGADSTVVETANGRYMVTVRVEDQKGDLVIMRMDNGFSVSDLRAVYEKEDPNVRPAGRVFFRNGELIRPAQDCSQGYGYGLNFMVVRKLDDTSFEEELLCKVLPTDVTITGVGKPEGIHTYNFTDHYEVIDHKEYEFGLVSKIGGVIRRIKKKLR